MKLKEKVRFAFYKLVGGQKDNKLTSKKVDEFLDQNILDSEIRGRILGWKKKLEFWEEYGDIYCRYHLPF